MSPLPLERSIVFQNKSVKMSVMNHAVGFILEVVVDGNLSLTDVAYVGQGIRDFLAQPVRQQRQMLLDISGAELFSLSLMEAFVKEMKDMRPLIMSHLQSSIVLASGALLENPLMREFRKRLYTPVRPNLILPVDRATEDVIIEFYRSNG